MLWGLTSRWLATRRRAASGWWVRGLGQGGGGESSLAVCSLVTGRGGSVSGKKLKSFRDY